MHVWGSFALHPMTLPIAEQVGYAVVSSVRYSLTMYGAVIQPTLQDYKFLFDHL